MRARYASAVACAVLLIGSTVALGCNAFVIADGEQVCLGRNLDVRFDSGYWIANPRGVTKTGWVPHDEGFTPPTWTAEYGSVTICGLHVDLPLGGMNEAGLAIEHLAVKSTYPTRDERPGLVQFQWMQYHLDTCGTVLELLAQEPEVRIEGWIFEVMHFIACDASGAVAVIEYLPGADGGSEQRVYTGDQVPEHMAALGNASYRAHIELMPRFEGFGGDQEVPSDRDTLAGSTRYQFAWSADRIRRYAAAPTGDPVGYAFDTLQRYTWSSTALSVVYDTARRHVHFVSGHNRDRRTIDLRRLDFTPGHRMGLFWHDAVSEDAWNTDIDYVNGYMLDHFAECGAPGEVTDYTEELSGYRAW